MKTSISLIFIIFMYFIEMCYANDFNHIYDNKKTQKFFKSQEIKNFHDFLNNKMHLSGGMHIFSLPESKKINNDAYLDLSLKKEINDFSYFLNYTVTKDYLYEIENNFLIGLGHKKYGTLQFANYNLTANEFISAANIRAGSDTYINEYTANLSIYDDFILNEFGIAGDFYGDKFFSISYQTTPFKNFKFFLSTAYNQIDGDYCNKEEYRIFPYKYIFGFGSMYEKNIKDNLKISLSFLTEFSNSYQNNLKNNHCGKLYSYFGSFLIEYKKISTVLAFGDLLSVNHFNKKKNLILTAVNFLDNYNSKFVDMAIAYKINDNLTGSISHFHSKNHKNCDFLKYNNSSNFHNTGLAFEYKSKNSFFNPYAEIDYFSFDSKNNDLVFLTGVNFKF